MGRVRAVPDQTFINMAFEGVWRVRTNGGEFLDLDVDPGGSSSRLVSNPVSRLRHGFRIRSIEDETETHRWNVWAEAVPLDGNASADLPVGTGAIYPFALVYDGCDRFVLEAIPGEHPLHATGGPTLQHAAEAVTELAEDGTDWLPVAMDPFTFLNTNSAIGFPTFTGDEQRAYVHIGTQLGIDPRSPQLTLAALTNVTRPEDIPQAAWDVVVRQLRVEIDFRELVRNYFLRVENFVQNVFIANVGMVDNVGALVQLDADNVIQLLLNSAMQAMAGAVGSLTFPGAGVVSGALTILFQQLAKDKGPNAGDFSVALREARMKMSALFTSLTTSVQKWRADVIGDWGKLKTMGSNLKTGQVSWPDNDEEMRKAACLSLEISLFKDLVKVRWNDMRASDDPTFHSSDSWIAGYMKKNPHYWVVATQGKQTDLFGKETKGYWVAMRWLGRGSTIFDHKQPDARLPQRIFDELKIPRQTVFKEWGLKPQTFYVQK